MWLIASYWKQDGLQFVNFWKLEIDTITEVPLSWSNLLDLEHSDLKQLISRLTVFNARIKELSESKIYVMV